MLFRSLIAAAVLAHAAVAAGAPQDDPIDVKVARSPQGLTVDVSLLVRASPDIAWKVLTDYGDMVRFVSTLSTSSVDSVMGNELRVTQQGIVKFGPLSFHFDTVRRIELVPYREVRSLIVDGSMKSSQFTTTLVPVPEGTRILQHGDVVPDRWVPPWIGPAVMVSGTVKQWEEFRAEILRRAANGAGAAPKP